MHPGKNGFTLIELLVAVLIIGILAAIALPQYNKVVTKARWIDAHIRLKAVADAEYRYLLATGGYTSDANNLDIAVNTTPPKEFNGLVIHLYAEGSSTKSHAEYPYKNLSVWAVGVFHNQKVYCAAPNGSTASKDFCKSVSGKDTCDTTLEPGYCYYMLGE
jgi:prepilin-type N-terminal cleavage/methylation domain-containing protein